MAWTTPKTTWVYTDYFNVADYNRIKDNLLYIANAINHSATLPIVDYTYVPNTTFFANVNILVVTLYELMTGADCGLRTVFYENNSAWDAEELNKIERLTYVMYRMLHNTKNHIPFVLGGVTF